MITGDLTAIEADIRRRAASYTPEWRFDTENPDIGSALAIVYARMMEQTVKKLTRVPFKNRVAFLNSLGADLLPAVPSEGFVSMSLVNEEVSAVDVPVGTAVVAESDMAPEGMVLFETTESMCATPAVISDILMTDGAEDHIEVMHSPEENSILPFYAFRGDGVNKQSHEFYMSHDTVLYINGETEIDIAFKMADDRPVEQSVLRFLANPEKVVFEYSTGETGWERLEKAEAPHGYIHLNKPSEKPPVSFRKIGDRESYWLRMRMVGKDIPDSFSVNHIELMTRQSEQLPDAVISPDGECNIRSMLPFGERLNLYDEVYFASEEAFSKRGANIVVSFRVDFARMPLDVTEREPFKWEWVMRRSDFREDLEFDVTIESVVWEYYNGTGWTRLFPTDEGKRAFSVPDEVSGQFQTISFICPPDMEKALVGARETYFIRARILKINNLYKQYGNYVLPVVENIGIKYSYKTPQKVQECRSVNNMETVDFDAGSDGVIVPFSDLPMRKKCCYLGFTTPPKGSPIRCLFETAGSHNRNSGRLLWEYSCSSGFKNLNPVDETDGLTRTGLITFTGPGDISPMMMFGISRYWIRIVDVDDTYRGEGAREAALIRSVCMNTTRVVQVTGHRTEFFRMDIYEKDKTFSLTDRNVCRIEVDVDEAGMLDEREEMELRDSGLLETETDTVDQVVHTWVRWQEVSDFYLSGKGDRHFVLSPREGKIQFGDGLHGRIPSSSDIQNIRVRYQTAGGDYTNVPPEAITHSDSSIGYVNRVYNPLALTGGCDPEQLYEGVNRNSAIIRHQNRAISNDDYELLAMEASRDIRLVKCFTGYNEDGEEKKGAVTLVVLGKSVGGVGFDSLRERIVSHMREKLSPIITGSRRFTVTEPSFVEIRLYIELTVESYEQVFEVREKIKERLAKAIAPKLTPEGEGFEIGEFPTTIRIQNTISDIEGIVFIQKLIINAYTASAGGETEVDPDTVKRRRYILPVNGEHEIVIHAE
ncbi:MAG: baseplate J/gp47 family protein [Eubacterium sp.]|nr:baseplate J/gp47 family protein [Eubacterium sp.]